MIFGGLVVVGVVVARVVSSLLSHQLATGCRWGWLMAWFRSGGHDGDKLPTRGPSWLGVESFFLAISGS
jgi:hypothetical protein